MTPHKMNTGPPGTKKTTEPIAGLGGIISNAQQVSHSTDATARPERRAPDPETIVATVSKNERERVYIVISDWRGERRLYLRIHRPDILGRWLPSQDGFAVDISKITELRAALELAEREARRRGFITFEEGAL
jgi:hypothetical protein